MKKFFVMLAKKIARNILRDEIETEQLKLNVAEIWNARQDEVVLELLHQLRVEKAKVKLFHGIAMDFAELSAQMQRKIKQQQQAIILN